MSMRRAFNMMPIVKNKHATKQHRGMFTLFSFLCCDSGCTIGTIFRVF